MNFKLLPSKYNIDLLRRVNAYLCFNESKANVLVSLLNRIGLFPLTAKSSINDHLITIIIDKTINSIENSTYI